MEAIERLIREAQRGRQNAYAPYSNYCVGAALETSSDRIFGGCNVENASYGLTICAERTAVFRAVAEGCHDFVRMAVVTQDGASPCGACRQVLHEFNPRLELILAIAAGSPYRQTSLEALLPQPFGP